MKIAISEYCIRCGLCVDLYPDLYRRNYEKHDIEATFLDVPDAQLVRVKQSIQDCAVGAIRLEK